MRFLRIKQAETALADNRLDEAFELSQSPDVRKHRRGQKVIGQLTRKLIERGGNHLENKRLPQALTDCNKAEVLAGNLPDIATLRSGICKAIENGRNDIRHNGLKLQEARKHIDNGRLSLGEKILDNSCPEAELLQKKADLRRLHIDDAAGRLKNALENNDLEAVLEAMSIIGAADFKQQKLTTLASEVKILICNKLRTMLAIGRVDLANGILQKAEPFAGESLDFQELSRAVLQLNRAGCFINQGHPRPAGRILRQMKLILPECDWLDEAISNIEKATEANEGLRNGPLGLVIAEESMYLPDTTKVTAQQRTEMIAMADKNVPNILQPDSPIPNQNKPLNTKIPLNFIVQVDGVGSYLVMRNHQVKIGAISSAANPDLGLVAEPDLPVATIARADEDYFLRTKNKIRINNVEVTEKLLANGDSIHLSPRTGFKFTRPNSASGTAMIELTSARVPYPDVRRVILMDREIVIGPGPGSHIRNDQCPQSVVLYLKDDGVYCRTKELITIDNTPASGNNQLPIGKAIQAGQISLVLINK
ncbi:MAG: hypothetical protein K9M57_08640 [Phycisphaerae bacterium]|nr:hypothetical protein [Phycisphaerae bacterium]